MIMRRGDTLRLVLSPSVGITFGSIAKTISQVSDYIILLLASVVGYLSWMYYYNQGLTLSYNDAMSHLDIARRVVEGLQPGIAQIGSVWLPLPHLLMLPFIHNDFLWHSGLAGSIVSGVAFIGSTFFIYKFTHLLTKDLFAGYLAAIIFAINPNMAYMQALPMTESVLIFFFVLSCYATLVWCKTDNIVYLILAAFSTLMGTLTRYDGWALFVQMIPVIAIVAFRKGRWAKMEGSVILFTALAAYGILLWFLWNLLIFKDPLYFINGPFSAKAQQLVFESEGRLLTKHNLLYSMTIYGITIIRNNGVFLTFVGAIGSLAYFWKNRLNSQSIVMTLLLAPFLFNVAALYFGHSIINLPDRPPYTLFNVRYGLLMLPTIAIFTSYLSRKQSLIQFLIIILLAMQTYLMHTSSGVITVKDGIAGASAQGMTETGRWLGKNAPDGLILIAASSQDSLIFRSGFPIKRFVHEGTGQYWEDSLSDPTKYIKWAAMHHGDLVYRKLHNNDNFLNNYERVYDGQFTDVYKYIGPRSAPMTEKDLP